MLGRQRFLLSQFERRDVIRRMLAQPKEGEVVNGDAWAHRWLDRRLAIIVCDGLGHGYEAAKSAVRAIECFNGSGWATPKELLDLANEALRPTRGAAAALAVIDPVERRVRFCGVGNITAVVVNGSQTRHLVSHNGIVGHRARRLAEFGAHCSPGGTLVMHTDGVSGRWRPEEWAGLWHRNPTLLASALWRDHSRGNDDAAVLVARIG